MDIYDVQLALLQDEDLALAVRPIDAVDLAAETLREVGFRRSHHESRQIHVFRKSLEYPGQRLSLDERFVGKRRALGSQG